MPPATVGIRRDSAIDSDTTDPAPTSSVALRSATLVFADRRWSLQASMGPTVLGDKDGLDSNFPVR